MWEQLPKDSTGIAIALAMALVWFGKLLVDKVFPSQLDRILALEKTQSGLVKEIRGLRDEVDVWKDKYHALNREHTLLLHKYESLERELVWLRRDRNE